MIYQYANQQIPSLITKLRILMEINEIMAKHVIQGGKGGKHNIKQAKQRQN